MDPERMAMVIEACTGKGVDEIEQMIRDSVHGPDVKDPALLAAFLDSRANGGGAGE